MGDNFDVSGFEELEPLNLDELVDLEGRPIKERKGEDYPKDTAPTFHSQLSVVQYAINSAGYQAVGITALTLPAGIYKLYSDSTGSYFVPTNISHDNLLVLPDTKSEEVLKEIDQFWARKDKYNLLKVKHKRGFLLHGPPGSGKTSTVIQTMQKMVNLGGVVILGGDENPSFVSNMLSTLRNVESTRPVTVVLEDIDSIIKRYDEASLLSLLDGEDSIDGVVFIATTNYPENLDGRVSNRPSRFDRVIKIDVPTIEARKVYLRHCAGEQLTEKEVDSWAEISEGFSIAHLKELIVSVLAYGGDLQEEAKRLKRMVITPKSSDRAPAGFGGRE